MVSKEPVINQEISYINGNGEMKLSTVSDYMKEFLSIIEIERKNYHICYKWKTPIGLFYDKLIMPLYGLNSSNLSRQIDDPKYTTLATDTIRLNEILQNYFKESFFEEVIYKNCSSVSSETIKATFTV